VTAHTNAAVDNLLSGLRDHGLKAARFGNSEVVRKDLQKYTLQELMEAHPLYAEWEEREKELKAVLNDMKAKEDGSVTDSDASMGK
jgi:hypothetical protein